MQADGAEALSQPKDPHIKRVARGVLSRPADFQQHFSRDDGLVVADRAVTHRRDAADELTRLPADDEGAR